MALGAAPWAPRCMVGGSAVLHGRIWIISGGTYDTPANPERLYHHDVWSSADGVEWTQTTPPPGGFPWEARSYHEVAAFDGKLWLMEGYTPASWITPSAGGSTFVSRARHGDAYLKDSAPAGSAETPTRWPHGNRNDVWWSEDGQEWHEVPTPWAPRCVPSSPAVVRRAASHTGGWRCTGTPRARLCTTARSGWSRATTCSRTCGGSAGSRPSCDFLPSVLKAAIHVCFSLSVSRGPSYIGVEQCQHNRKLPGNTSTPSLLGKAFYSRTCNRQYRYWRYW